METIDFRELVELFLNTSFREIKSETETPNINFKFGEDAFDLFQSIVENPFIKKDAWTPNADQEDIDFIKSHNNDKNVPNIYINDSVKFFEYLTNIINSTIELNLEYEIKSSPRNLAKNILRRIWLRMGIEDVENIEDFLDKQLQFTKNRLLDTPNMEKISISNGYEIFKESKVNQTWDETTRSIIFTIKRNNATYELPHILYDIDDEELCYIYAVQSSKNQKDKTIERDLYKLNKNIEDPNVHPSKVCSMILFINELKKKGITRIRIPSMQILSYRYHELLSEKAFKDLEEEEKSLKRFPNDKYTKRNYELAKKWYDAVYEKQDKISYLKTTELMNLAYRILEHDPSIEIINEVNLQGDYLGIKIR